MQVLDKIERKDYNLNDEEILELLNMDTTCSEFYRLLAASNCMSREKFGSKGYVFAQIGINAEPCSVNCRFCSMGADHYSLDGQWQKDVITIKEELNRLQLHGIDDFFLMSTADYPVSRLLEIAKEVKSLLREDQKFVVNTGDFDFETAKELKNAGFTGVYHINRLREGIDTNSNTGEREETIEALSKAGMELYYCIEPIGPEHSYEELLTEIKRARDLQIAVMAVMRRIPVMGTPLYELGKISAMELTKIAAVTNIVVNPSRSMNVHEPIQMALLAGVNQLYAEVGANPRDVKSDTERSRGFTPDVAWEMLKEGGYRQQMCPAQVLGD